MAHARAGTVSIAIVRVLVRALDERRAQRLVDELGLSAAQLADDDARLPRELASRAWRLAPELSGDPLFGLHLAERLPFGAFGALELLARGSRTLRESLTRTVQYYALLDGRDALAIETTGTRTSVVYTLEQRNHHVAECMVGTVARIARELWPDLRPAAVEVAHAAAAPAAEYGRSLGIVPRFGGTATRISFDTGDLDRVAPATDRQVMATVGVDGDDLLHRIGAAIEELLPEQQCSAARVARRVGLGERTLRRRLSGAGATLSELVDRTRYELARRHLADARLSVYAIARMLGFSDQRAFARAFKRWTGKSPVEFRGDPG